MLSHRTPIPHNPPRTVVLGAAGFVGQSAVRQLREAGAPTMPICRQQVDLLDAGASTTLAKLLNPGDTVVFVAARAPCKNPAMLTENVRMAETMLGALQNVPIAHLIYISSDAVYKDSREPLNEASCAEPNSVHGAMHLAREVILRAAFDGPFAILRPTLIYGQGDPHNGYGPNRFRRLAEAGTTIELFGNGEELRDHVDINDVGMLVRRIAQQGSVGILNAVSGSVVSFRELAEFISTKFVPKVPVVGTVRTGPVPHNGYRAFDAKAIGRAFDDIQMRNWKNGVASLCEPASNQDSR